MYKFNKVDEALWVAAAIMIYEKVMELKKNNNQWTKENIYFKQSLVLKKANEICTKSIEAARVSYHLDAENPKSSHKYFMKMKNGSFIRLVYSGEMDGNKEKPENLKYNIIVDTLYGAKYIEELCDFIDNEYTDVIKKNIDEEKLSELTNYYEIAVEDEGVESMVSKKQIKGTLNKNQILYGPPGTGKTYNVINKALEIINEELYSEIINDCSKRADAVNKFNELRDKGQISFCTFHQSYGYEDFVEGLRSSKGGNGFVATDGIFKQICTSASEKQKIHINRYDFDEKKINFFKMSLGVRGADEDIYDYCIENNCVALGRGGDVDYADCNSIEDIRDSYYKQYPDAGEREFDVDAINRYKLWMKKDDIIIVSNGNKMARAIGKVTGDYIYDVESAIGYRHFRDVEWLYYSDNIDINKIMIKKQFSQQAIYMFGKEDLNIQGLRELISNEQLEEELESGAKNYVLIIDEINRGNISKIFGELITLIEGDKRIGEKNEIKVTLPYSNDTFGVPSNLYILGTMNTADRSIALLDTALRRRFDFVEYMPNENLLPEDIDGVNVRKLLKTINNRIEFLFDRDHTIGHAYFIGDNLNLNGLVNIMKSKVIPLIEEYFYGDWEKIALVLGGTGKAGEQGYFILKEKVNKSKLFKGIKVDDYEDQYRYSIAEKPTIEAFKNVLSEDDEA